MRRTRPFDAGIDIGSQLVKETVIQQSTHPKMPCLRPSIE
jgi:hypothetical protein